MATESGLPLLSKKRKNKFEASLLIVTNSIVLWVGGCIIIERMK